MKSVRVSIDETRCVGSGQCVMAVPEVFDQRDSDGTAVALEEVVAPPQADAVREAARLCPSRAILVEDV